MVGAVPGVTVEPQLSNFPQFQEKVRIGLSARSDEIDLMACSGAKVREFAKAGWLEPLDDLWDKYRAEYDLDDMPVNVVDNMRYEGRLYAVPFGMNTMFFFYRKDLFDEKGVQPPTTMEEYVELAKMFHTPRRSGARVCAGACGGARTVLIDSNPVGVPDVDQEPRRRLHRTSDVHLRADPAVPLRGLVRARLLVVHDEQRHRVRGKLPSTC